MIKTIGRGKTMSDEDIEERYARMVGEVCPRCDAVLRVFSKRIRLKKGSITIDILKCENCGYTEE